MLDLPFQGSKAPRYDGWNEAWIDYLYIIIIIIIIIPLTELSTKKII